MNNIQLEIKNLLKEIFKDIITCVEEQDLQGLLNDLIYYYKNTNSSISLKLVDSLYELKKIRNDIAHQRNPFSKYYIISIYSKIHNFIELIKENGIGIYNGNYINSYQETLEKSIEYMSANKQHITEKILDIKTIKNKYAETENTIYTENNGEVKIDVNTTLESYILGFSKMKAQVFNLMYNIGYIKEALQNNELEKLEMINKNNIGYMGNKEIHNIFCVVMAAVNKINIEDSEEWDAGVPWADPYDDGLFEEVNINISDIISLLKRNINSTDDNGSLFEKTKTNITAGMQTNISREELIRLREKIIKETGIDRKDCILRKTNLDTIFKYNIRSLEDLNLYILNDEKEIIKQKKYINEILSILNKKT